MNEKLKIDLETLPFILDKVKNQGLDYLGKINERATTSQINTNRIKQLNEEGFGAEETLQLFNERYESLIVASGGPRFWGYVTGGATPASIVGDWLSSIYDQNPQAINGAGDISANIELETIDLLLDLLALPHDFLGGFVTGATMSNVSCLAVARQWLGKTMGRDIAKEGVAERLNVLSATPHSSAVKSLSLLGMGSQNIIPVKTIEGNREAISIVDLENKIQALNGKNFILVASGGTVNTVDFDDFSAIHKLKQKYDFWWHIDAAFGGFAACTDSHKHLVKDWGFADSITVDCHKWLNVPYESAVFFIKEKYKNLQGETFQNSNAPYLDDQSNNFSYLNLLPENSRRLKALPTWFTLMAYGKEGYKNMVENNITLAQLFGDKIEKNSGFELMAPIRLNNLCFTLSEGNDDEVMDFLSRLNNTGKVFMTPTFYLNRKGIRASFVNWRTSKKDVNLVFDEMQKILRSPSFDND